MEVVSKPDDTHTSHSPGLHVLREPWSVPAGSEEPTVAVPAALICALTSCACPSSCLWAGFGRQARPARFPTRPASEGRVRASDPRYASLQIEMAILRFPYESWGTPFQQLKQVVEEPSPQLPADRFSPEFVDFTAQW